MLEGLLSILKALTITQKKMQMLLMGMVALSDHHKFEVSLGYRVRL